MDASFSDKVVLISGGGGGMARAIARTFAVEGASVVLVDRDETSLRQAQAQLGETPAPVEVVTADLTDADGIRALADRVQEQMGHIDVLVNAAGVVRSGTLDTYAVEDWDLTMTVNVRGTFLLSQAVGAHMIEARSGAIVNISSIGGHSPRVGGAAYSVSKAAVRMLTGILAAEWGPHGVRCNAISPGYTEHLMVGVEGLDASVVNRQEQAIPSRRMGTMQDMADAVAFLASDKASYVNGVTLLVDGGLHANLLTLMPTALEAARPQ